MALFLDLVPKEQQALVTRNLVNDIVYRHNTHVTTGFIGVRYLLPLLTRLGRSDLAYELASQTTYPSWGYMVEHGATTLWELWQEKTGPSMNSHNHHMFGSVDGWFYQALAGINPDPEAVGYGRILIQPQVVRDLEWASGAVNTIRGRVASAWTRSPGVITVDVEIPVNSTASIVIPKDLEMTEIVVREGDRVVWEKGHFVAGVAGVTGGSESRNGVILEVGSGRYSFRLQGQ
jgi:alpha-L-rhamnosidase